MISEKEIQNDIRVGLSRHGHITWRNNVGLSWAGTVIKDDGDIIILKNRRPIKFGLCKGSGDLIGISDAGKFVSIEVKNKNGVLSDEQENFIRVVRRNYGLAGVARSLEEALGIIEDGVCLGMEGQR